MTYPSHLPEWQRREALDAFQHGILLLHTFYAGRASALEEAIVALRACLEWATPETFPQLAAEASAALHEALSHRQP